MAPNKKGDIKKVVLAYSGGLDTSVILKWLQNTYGAGVVTFTADIGQGDEVEDARQKAAAAGVKPGDVLVRWAGKEVRDVQHWTELLGGHKPGDKVEIEVMRDKKVVKMTVLLKAR